MEEDQFSEQTNKNTKELIILLDRGEDEVWERAVQALVEKGTPAVSLLIEALKNDEVGIRAGAASALGQIRDSRAVEPLMGALSDHFRRVKAAAAIALGHIGTPAAEPLIAALQSEREYYDQGWITTALGQIGQAAITPLLPLFKEKSSQLNYWVANTLGRIGIPALEILGSAVKDEDPKLRAGAARALGEINEARAIEFLSQALKDEESDVRITAILALGDSKNAAAFDPLIAALEDADQDTVARVVYGLGKLANARAIEPLIATFSTRNSYEVRRQIAFAMQQIGTAAIAPLISALDSDDPAIRAGAAFALGHKKNQMRTDVTEALLRVLKDENVEVRYNAAYALGYLNDPQALSELKLVAQIDKGQNLQGKRVAAVAAKSIEKINSSLSQTVISKEDERRHKIEKAENLKKLNNLLSKVPELKSIGFLEENESPVPEEIIYSLLRIGNEPFSRIKDTSPQEEKTKWVRSNLKEARIREQCYFLKHRRVPWLDIAIGEAGEALVELIVKHDIAPIIVSADRRVILYFWHAEYFDETFLALQTPTDEWIRPSFGID